MLTKKRFYADIKIIGVYCLTDGDVSTSWKCGDTQGWFVIDLGKSNPSGNCSLSNKPTISKYTLAISPDHTDNWATIYSGQALSAPALSSFMGYGYGEINLSEPVKTQKIKFTIISAKDKPAVYSVRIK